MWYVLSSDLVWHGSIVKKLTKMDKMIYLIIILTLKSKLIIFELEMTPTKSIPQGPLKYFFSICFSKYQMDIYYNL
jgi:hypothetical protein